MSWSSSKTWGRKPVHERGLITWSDNSGSKPAPFVKPISKYKKIKDVPVEYENFLFVGALWTVRRPLRPDLTSGATFPSLVLESSVPSEEAAIRPGSFLIYTGIVRVEEREKKGRIVSVSRHTFIAAGARYVVTNFVYVKPVTADHVANVTL